MDLFIELAREVPGAEMVKLNGVLLSACLRRALRAAQTRREVVRSGERLERLYFAWTTCSRCARAHGHNYVIVFAPIQPAARIEAAASGAPA